ncbi:MAG: polysaccharide biosynthesis/export protein [Chthoniobacter sp.]|jgi:polysaccharide export outer membrane protein|nr:polysaccharide biosynthesis/export protein [Chthoniobacter sp.]
MKSLYLISLLAVILLCCGGCQNTNPTSPRTGSIPTRIDDTLAPGDVLKIAFSGAPELSQTQKIRPDGNISLPKIGEIQAAGKKPSAIRSQLISLYKASLQNSEITVIVESSSFHVIVLGAVNRPGEVNLDRPTLLQAIGKAGGVVRGLGDASRIRIIHEGDKAREVNLEAVLNGKSDTVIYLQRGDTVVVPEKWL